MPTNDETRTLAREIIAAPLPPREQPIVIDTLGEAAMSELVTSYDRKFSDAIDKGGSIYLPMTPLERAGHDRKMQLLDQLSVGDLTDKICVDFGVGSWGFAGVYPRLQKCRFAVGIDISAEAIRESAYASAKGGFPYGERYAYLTSRGDDIRLRDAVVDVFFSGECIEHVENTDAFLDEVHRVLRPSGLLVLTTPNADAYLYRIRGDRYCPGVEHVSLMGLDELLAYLDPRFEVLEVKGIASSVHHEFDDAVLDEAFARSWVRQFANEPGFATGLVVLARSRPAYRPSRYEERRLHHADASIVYEGPWRPVTLHESLTARLAESGGRGSLRVHFKGTDLLLFLWAHAWSGEASISVDGCVSLVDLYAAQSGFRRLHMSGLGEGIHELVIRQTGVRSGASEGDEVIFHQAISYQRAAPADVVP